MSTLSELLTKDKPYAEFYLKEALSSHLDDESDSYLNVFTFIFRDSVSKLDLPKKNNFFGLSPDEKIKYLRSLADSIEEADDLGSIDHWCGSLQRDAVEFPQIQTIDGGI